MGRALAGAIVAVLSLTLPVTAAPAPLPYAADADHCEVRWSPLIPAGPQELPEALCDATMEGAVGLLSCGLTTCIVAASGNGEAMIHAPSWDAVLTHAIGTVDGGTPASRALCQVARSGLAFMTDIGCGGSANLEVPVLPGACRVVALQVVAEASAFPLPLTYRPGVRQDFQLCRDAAGTGSLHAA